MRAYIGILIFCESASFSCTSTSRQFEESKGSSNLITREQISAYYGQNAFDVVSGIHPRWLNARRAVAIAFENSKLFPLLYVDGIIVGRANDLVKYSAIEIDSIEFIRGSEAEYKYGSIAKVGVILITRIH